MARRGSERSVSPDPMIAMGHKRPPVLPHRAVAPLHDIEVDPAQVKAIIEKVRPIESRIRGLVSTSLAGSEEREATMLLLVDVSASGDLGSTMGKRDLAAELACVLALVATTNHDQVGLVLFSDQIERFVPPGKGRSHSLRVVREILGCRPEGRGTDVAAALRLAGSVVRRRTSMFLISDLELGPSRARSMLDLQRAARPIAARHDVIALHVRDPHERTLPDVGLVTIEDAETGEVLAIDTGRKLIREKFAKLARARAAETKQMLRRANVETVEIDTAQSYVPVLLDFFAGRERRHG